MMNISPSIGKILNRYGCDVTVKNGGKSVRTKAFISPLRYNSNQNYDSVRHKLGMRKTKLFLRIYLTQKINFLISSAIYAIRNMLLSRRQDIFIEKMMTPFRLLIGQIPWNAGWQLHIDYRSS